eukprot:768729-Hanusia_phi.AAC.5
MEIPILSEIPGTHLLHGLSILSCDNTACLNCITNTTSTRSISGSRSLGVLAIDNLAALDSPHGIPWTLLAAKAKSDAGPSSSSSSSSTSGRPSKAIVAVLLWVQMFQVIWDHHLHRLLLDRACFQISILSTPMAAFTYTIGIMFNDLSHSLFMILILIAGPAIGDMRVDFAKRVSGFGSALTILGDAPFDQGWDTTVVLLFQEVLRAAMKVKSDWSSGAWSRAAALYRHNQPHSPAAACVCDVSISSSLLSVSSCQRHERK